MTELSVGQHRGWEVLTLTDDAVSLQVVPALGGTITTLTRLRDGGQVLWNPPWALRPRGAPTLPGSAEATMLDSWPGGWQTLFPNAGDATSAHGVELGFDGESRICWLDWDFSDSVLTMTGRLSRSPFILTKTVTVDDAAVTLRETVANVGAESIEAMWGQQLTFGRDLLGPDAIVDAAASVVHPDPVISYQSEYTDITPWPRAHGPQSMINLRSVPAADAGQTRLAYLTEFSRAALSVVRPSSGLGVDLTWDLEAWPHVWYSLEAGARRGYPWFRDGYFLTLTPCTSWPARGVHEARRVSGSAVWIDPSTTRTSELTVTVHS